MRRRGLNKKRRRKALKGKGEASGVAPTAESGKSSILEQGNKVLGKRGTPFLEDVDPVPWVQTIVEVTDDDDTDNQLYKVKRRYWNNKDEKWETEDKEYELDSSDLDITLTEEDRVVAFWDATRKMFVPTTGGEDEGVASAIEFKLTERLLLADYRAAAEVTNYSGIWDYYDGSDPGRYLYVYNKKVEDGFMFEGLIGRHGMALYNKRMKRYVIWNLNC
jgi:hypothetical protein